MGETGRVAVVIPNWNGRALLAQVLADLRAQTRCPDYLIVVDNGSTDGSAEEAVGSGVELIAFSQNRGFAAAVNAGIRRARELGADWIAIINNDVTLPPAWLEILLRTAEAKDAWFVSGKLLRREHPEIVDGGYDLVSRAGCAWRAGSGEPDGPLWSRPQAVAFIPLTAALLRSEIFARCGELDERFESYLEDVDFSLRCALAGCRGFYEPSAVAYHQGSATLGRWHPETVRRLARNQVWLVAKHFPSGLALRWAWSIFVGQLLWGAVAFRHNAGWAFVVGKVQGILSYQRIRGSATVRRTGSPLALILTDSEQQLRHLQEQSTFKRYWRWYFRLT